MNRKRGPATLGVLVLAAWTVGFPVPGVRAQVSDRDRPALEGIPAFRKGFRILFQGDSITDGNRRFWPSGLMPPST